MTTLPYDLDGVEYNIIAGQNSDTVFTFDLTVGGVVQPVAGTTPVLTIKAGYKETVALTVTKTSTPSVITLDTQNNLYTVTLNHVDLLVLNGGQTYVYDVIVQSGAAQYRMRYGTLAIRPAVKTS